MKLAFAHHQNLLGPTAGRKPGATGIHTAGENIALHLKEISEQFDYLAPLKNICSPAAAVRIAVGQKLTRDKYYGWAEPSLSRGYGRQIAKKLNHSSAKAVLCTEVKHAAFLNTDRPVAVWTDSMYGGLFGYYQTFSGLSRRTQKNLQEMDRAAVAGCARLIFASDWAAQKAVNLYGASPEQVKVVPYGANLTSGFSREDAKLLVDQKSLSKGPCRLLFAGVEWHRKGGDTAIRIAELLIRQGLQVELIFLGTDPARHMTNVPDFVQRVGFLSLSKPDERAKMEQLYKDAHFLLQPCRAECFGHIFPEANSFALPAIASNTGGIPTAIHEGVNGYCFDPEEAPSYANCIARLFQAPDEYRDLSMKAFDDYEARLSWTAAARQVIDILAEL